MRSLKFALIVLALFVIGAGGSYLIAQRAETAAEGGKALIGGPFSLLDSNGRPVSDRDFRGKLMLVFFGYTHCPDVCPTELQNMADALAKLGDSANEVAPIFISVDPERDTPGLVGEYVKLFGNRIIGLTGSTAQVASAAKAYRVYFRKAASADGDENYAVDHSGFVYLMDRQGNYLTHFSFQTLPDDMASVIKKHLTDAGSA